MTFLLDVYKRQGAEHAAGAAENSFPEDMVKEKQTEIKGDGKDQATVFVYMNGSDLESEDGEATEDLCEMLAANISSQVNVLVETDVYKRQVQGHTIAQEYRFSGNREKIRDNAVSAALTLTRRCILENCSKKE